MSDVLIIALISFGGTLLGTFGGIITSNRLTCYRIEQLEKKVEKHNTLVERMSIVECVAKDTKEHGERMEHRLQCLELK